MNEMETVTPVRIDRKSNGRFASGNKGGPGNPFAKKCGLLRKALMQAATVHDVRAALDTIRDVMANGTPLERLAAAKIMLDRLLGKSHQSMDVVRLFPMGAEAEPIHPANRQGDEHAG